MSAQKTYRVKVDMSIAGHVDILADNKAQAGEKARVLMEGSAPHAAVDLIKIFEAGDDADVDERTFSDRGISFYIPISYIQIIKP